MARDDAGAAAPAAAGVAAVANSDVAIVPPPPPPQFRPVMPPPLPETADEARIIIDRWERCRVLDPWMRVAHLLRGCGGITSAYTYATEKKEFGFHNVRNRTFFFFFLMWEEIRSKCFYE